ncbi:MAG: 1-acyl-sn-glycerol-3-phosphate acyltransferase [Putridiphycobacter sp.]
MKRLFGRFVLKLMGWKIDPEVPPHFNRCVLVMAPHTSNWDYFIGMMAFWGVYQKDIKQLIKKDLFFPPLGWILKSLGGIPVNRKGPTKLTKVIAEMYQKQEDLTIVFTPEGTRSYNPNWKKGFYYIAKEANVPICVGFLDYSNKTGGVLPIKIEVTENEKQDIDKIKSIYTKYKGKYPENGVK